MTISAVQNVKESLHQIEDDGKGGCRKRDDCYWRNTVTIDHQDLNRQLWQVLQEEPNQLELLNAVVIPLVKRLPGNRASGTGWR